MTANSEDRERHPDPEAKPDAASERAVLRWLAGEMGAGEARAFEERLAGDPALARAAEARRRTWRRLEAPASAPGEGVPPGFSGRVMAQVRREAGGAEAGSAETGGAETWGQHAAARGPLSAAWSRAAGAAALAGGVALGLVLGMGGAQVTAPALDETSVAAAPAVAVSSSDPALSDPTLSYAYDDLYTGLADGSARAGGGDSGSSAGETGGTLAADYAAVLGELSAGEGT